MVPWLRICGEAASFGACRQNAEFLLHDGIADHFGQRGHGADFEPPLVGAHAAQLFDLAQIDHHLGSLDAILEPVEAVEPAGQHPGVRAVAVRAAPARLSIVAG